MKHANIYDLSFYDILGIKSNENSYKVKLGNILFKNNCSLWFIYNNIRHISKVFKKSIANNKSDK